MKDMFCELIIQNYVDRFLNIEIWNNANICFHNNIITYVITMLISWILMEWSSSHLTMYLVYNTIVAWSHCMTLTLCKTFSHGTLGSVYDHRSIYWDNLHNRRRTNNLEYIYSNTYYVCITFVALFPSRLDVYHICNES